MPLILKGESMRSSVKFIGFGLFLILQASVSSATESFCEDFVTKKTLVEIPHALYSEIHDFSCEVSSYGPCSYDRLSNPGASFDRMETPNGIDINIPSSGISSRLLPRQNPSLTSSFSVNIPIQYSQHQVDGYLPYDETSIDLKYDLGPNCELKNIKIMSPDDNNAKIVLNNKVCSLLKSFSSRVNGRSVLTPEQAAEIRKAGGGSASVKRQLAVRAGGGSANIEREEPHRDKNPTWTQALDVCELIGDAFFQESDNPPAPVTNENEGGSAIPE